MRLVPIVRPLLAAALCCAVLPVFAHEFWIAPDRYRIAPGDPLTAQFKNGENFDGINLGFFDRRSVRFDLIQGGSVQTLRPRIGSIPALDRPAPHHDGLMVLAHETAPQTITYSSWETFQRFADHKGFADIRARHLARGLPLDGFTERYTRHVKALIGVGSGLGSDSALGLETEFVVLRNPYTDDLSAGLPVQLFYQGAPRSGAQIELFARAPDGTVTVTTHRTDDKGQARLPVRAGHVYLLDAVMLRDSADAENAVWDTLWAALTFAVP